MQNESIKRYRLGDLLVYKEIISEDQLKQALELQKKMHRWLGDCLIELGMVTDDDIANVLELQLGIPRINLRGARIEHDIISLVNGSVLRKHNVLPVKLSDENPNVLILAMSNPLDMTAQDDIAIITNKLIEPRIATIGEINSVLDKYFGTGEAMSVAEQYVKEREEQILQEQEEQDSTEQELESAPIVQLVRSVIEQAVRQRASDIHFDALEKQVRVRYRVDGVLTEKMLYDLNLLPALTTRIKIMSGMDISERRRPQDGRFSINIDRNEYDMRVAIIPTAYGEKIVMRISSKTGILRDKTQLGMEDYELKTFDSILSRPNGIILATGPTGSGKSTTLYAALTALNKEESNIVTIEDPIEANIAGVNQVQVNNKADLTFANSLRSILRHDPDIIMIGEIRDRETATIAVQASITGHLVVSTLHTNNSAATITRLLEMGVEEYLLADSIVGIIAQRLVRRLCNSCKKPREATIPEKELMRIPSDKNIKVFDAVGCHYCNNTGYYERIGVYEILEMTPEIRRGILTHKSTEEIKDIAVKNGMRTLFTGASLLVLKGITTFDELLKVSFDS